ncbi:RNA-binding protein with multiple splicing 2, partial [Cichlidogyrus casuarinus]
PVGFVTFETRELAEAAMADLKGVKFDPEGTQHMRLEFARSNTKVTRPKNPLSSPVSSLNPLGLAGMIATNSMCVGAPGSAVSHYGTQMTLGAAQQQAINLANIQAAIGGNSSAVIPQLFQPLGAFDPNLLDHTASQWGAAAAGSTHPQQPPGFDSAAILNQ